ncbi:hypothetical protein QR680_000083 [Steinernema hermaphroditum]|uniref:Uncharacterized protein n=1 Tax=Steinernema hermaphroditum TaxID=289476 RepID=A0AA39GT98_9BILA|nr:hypothetical protein QR680_000083 [Steinernema hermaphroditum]
MWDCQRISQALESMRILIFLSKVQKTRAFAQQPHHRTPFVKAVPRPLSRLKTSDVRYFTVFVTCFCSSKQTANCDVILATSTSLCSTCEMPNYHYSEAAASWQGEAEKTKRIAVIDVMNFLHTSASKKDGHPSHYTLDAVDLVSFSLMLLRREFDVRAIVPRFTYHRIKNRFLLYALEQLGLLIFTGSAYDDLVVIRYASETVTDAEKYVILNRTVKPTINPFHQPEGQTFSLTENGDRIANFVAFLYAQKPEVIYANRDSPDYERCIYERERFTFSLMKMLRSELQVMFDIVEQVQGKSPRDRGSNFSKLRRVQVSYIENA